MGTTSSVISSASQQIRESVLPTQGWAWPCDCFGQWDDSRCNVNRSH